MTTTETLAQQIERCFRTVDFEPLRDLYDPAAVLDATVPRGRFQCQGPERILARYRDAYSQFNNPLCTWLRLTTAEALVLVEWELQDGEGDGKRLVREVDVIRTNGGRIIEQAHYCPGVSGVVSGVAALDGRRAAAPMVQGSSDSPVVVIGGGPADLAVSHELTSPRRCRCGPAAGAGDHCSGLPESRSASAREGPRGGQRPDRVPDLRGAP